MGQSTEIPAQFRPAERDKTKLASQFAGALDKRAEDPAVTAIETSQKRRADALEHHNLSMFAVENHQTGTRALTGSVAMIVKDGQQQTERKKREEEGLERVMNRNFEATRQRLQQLADEWGKIADEYEKKLGGLDAIGKTLGVERKPGQTEEEYRRWLNDIILARIANGEIDPNSDMAAMARARDQKYRAQDQQARLDKLSEEAKRTGDFSKLDGELKKADQTTVMLRDGLKEHGAGFRGEMNTEFDDRLIEGGTGKNFYKDAAAESQAALSFLDEEFAETAVAMDVTGSFNNAVAGVDAEPEPALATNTVQVEISKPTGMV